MSLQVWLPLDGDLRNNGLNNITVVSNGATVDSYGKLGQCYYFNGSGNRISIIDQLSYIYPISIAAWVYPTYATSTKAQYMLSYSIDAQGTAGQSIGFGMDNGSFSVWCGGAQYNYSTLTDNTWYHIALTIDASNNYKVYINGTNVTSGTCGNALAAKWLTIGARSYSSTGGNGGANSYFKGRINDVRLYDNVLSDKEIKLLSQGLIVHFPLNGNGRGGENFVPNSTGYKGVSGWTGIVSVGNENGKPYFITQRTDTTSTSRTFIYNTSLASLINSWSEGTKFTISGYYKVPSSESYDVTANLFIRWKKPDNSTEDTGFETLSPSTVTKDKWIRFERTFAVPTGYNGGGVAFYLSGFRTGLSTVYWKDVKLELGEVATSWMPCTVDVQYSQMGYNSTDIYDTSGFVHNGTITSLPTYDTNSAKYSLCTYIDDGLTSKITAPIIIGLGDAITMSIWIRSKNGTTGTGNYHMPLNINGQPFEFSISNDGKFRQGFVVSGTRVVGNYGSGNLLSDKKWHMLSATFNGAHIKRYIDGELVDTTAASGTLNRGSFNVYIGTYGNSTSYGVKELYLNDARIYATALSDNDILELYHTGASIADNGTLLANEFIEG